MVEEEADIRPGGGGTQRRLEVRRFSETEWSLTVRLVVLLILGAMLAYGLVSFWRMMRLTSLDSRAFFFMPVALAGALGVVVWRSWVVARQLRREIRGVDADDGFFDYGAGEKNDDD